MIIMNDYLLFIIINFSKINTLTLYKKLINGGNSADDVTNPLIHSGGLISLWRCGLPDPRNSGDHHSNHKELTSLQ